MDLINLGVNVVAYNKKGRNFAMTCAWAMQVGYEELYLLLGSQSDTGNNIEIGDIIGVSSLNSSQKDIGLTLGENHSLTSDKLKNIDYIKDDGAIIIKNAKVMIKGKVIDVFHPKGNDEDHIIHVKALDIKGNENLFFLNRDELR